MQKHIRRSQVVVPFGVGAMVDFPRESLISAGLDAWEAGNDADVICDERLSKRIGVKQFRLPPAGKRAGGSGDRIPFLRFPEWHFCPRCRGLIRIPLPVSKRQKCDNKHVPSGKQGEFLKNIPCSSLPPRKKPYLVQVRFVVACEKGHLSDFPWVQWAHKGCGMVHRDHGCPEPRIYLHSSGRSGLEGLIVRCDACEAWRPLTGAAGDKAMSEYGCDGRRPWLGESSEECGLNGRLLQRGASNVYFPRTAGSILIPPFSSNARRFLDNPRIWKTISSAVGADGRPESTRVGIIAELYGLDPDVLAKAAEEKMAGIPDSIPEGGEDAEHRYRAEEYRVLLAGHSKPGDQLLATPQEPGGFDGWVGDYFSDIVLVEKLAETRAFLGFSRIKPSYSSFDMSVDWGLLAEGELDWVPASRVFGEGIFLTLRRSRVLAWEKTWQERAARLETRYRSFAEEVHREPRRIPPRFLLLHTLAHALIRRLCFDAGYGTSSLRERIYCHMPDNPGATEGPVRHAKAGKDAIPEMHGLLIYTAAGDAEGTMGGLVRQGRHGKFEEVVLAAIRDSVWCASDPICRESTGQGTDSMNLAACHACTLLPETSCEEGNRLLDRMALVGAPPDAGSGYFSDIEKESLGMG